MSRAAAVAVLLFASLAAGELVRGAIKIDVRDASGAAVEAKVTVRPRAGGETRSVPRTGEVYVADGLLDGDWIVEAPGAAAEIVRVVERHVVGAVLVLGGAPRTKKKERPFTVGPDEPACNVADGAVVEAVAFAHGGLGAGRLEVHRGARLVCSATIAGGAASLRLPAGEYSISARFVGGGSAHAVYRWKSGAPPSLVLRAK